MNKLRNIIKESLLCVKSTYERHLTITEKGINTLVDTAKEEILKDFVHKDNLPSVKKIRNIILKEFRKTDEYVAGDSINYATCLEGNFNLKSVAIAIRKLIEGNK